MRILALDSSGLVASVAIVEEQQMIAEYTINHKKTHSQTLLPMLDEIVKMTQIDLNSIDAIAVAGGPGSFTGLRIGSATAKGLGFALNKPLIHIPTVEALAYNLYGNLGSVANTQGTNFVLNNLFGVILNSASGIATTVSNVVNSFSSNLLVAFRPRITKCYALGDIKTFQDLFIWSIKLILFVYALIAIPIFVEIDTILSLWLKHVPPYTSIFCRCILVNMYFETLRYIITMGIHAVGRVKIISICTGTVLLINPIIIYIMLTNIFSPIYTYYSIILGNGILCILDIFFLKKYIPILNLKKICISIVKSFCLTLFILFLSLYWTTFFQPGIGRILFTINFSIISFSVLFYWGYLNAEQRKIVCLYLVSKIKYG